MAVTMIRTVTGSEIIRIDTWRRTAVLLSIVLLLKLVHFADAASSAQRHHGSNRQRDRPSATSAGSSPTRRGSTAHEDYAEQTDIGNVRDFEDGNEDYEEATSSGRRSATGARQRDDDVDEQWPPTNCTQCGVRQFKRDYRIESIKSEILRKLRLNHPPNVTVPRLPAIPHIQRMVDELTYQSDAPWSAHGAPELQYESDDDHATTLKLLLFSVSAVTPQMNSSAKVFQFRFQPDMRREDVLKASLGIYIKRHPNTRFDNQPTMILLYRFERPDRRDRFMAGRRLIQINAASVNQWYHFNVRSLVHDWLDDPSSNYGLEVLVADSNGNPLAVVNPTDPSDEPFKPYMEIHVREQTQTRSKRMTNNLDCDEFSTERRCCRYPLLVDFASFGWDWVIVPRQYSAFYCSGECPFLYHQSSPHRHLVQQQAGASSAISTSTSCCSPRRVSAISMLYYDEHMNIVYGRLPGMVVEQCGCS